MSNYDSPGWTQAVPGLGSSFDPRAGNGAQGTAGGMRPDSAEFGDVHATFGYDPSGGVDVPQGVLSTSNDNDALKDAVSAVVTPTSVAGHVCGPSHPNAGK